YTLESRNQSNECEIALLDDQVRELRRELAKEREEREKLAAELEAARAEIQSLRTDLLKKIDAHFHILWEYTNGVRRHNTQRYGKTLEEHQAVRAELAAMRTELTNSI